MDVVNSSAVLPNPVSVWAMNQMKIYWKVRDAKHTNFVEFRNYKIIYRRYAGLFFCLCVDIEDNNLMYLEAIHNFVEVRMSLSEFRGRTDYLQGKNCLQTPT